MASIRPADRIFQPFTSAFEGGSGLGLALVHRIVQDYGDIVVHVFDQESRSFYALEELWADAPRIDWKRA